MSAADCLAEQISIGALQVFLVDRRKILPELVQWLENLRLLAAQALILWQLHVGVLESLQLLELLLSVRLLQLSVLALHLVVEHVACGVSLAFLDLEIHGRRVLHVLVLLDPEVGQLSQAEHCALRVWIGWLFTIESRRVTFLYSIGDTLRSND